MIHVKKFCHSKISDLCSVSSTNHKDIVTGEVAMYDVIGVEVGKGQGDIVAEVHLYMVREWLLGSLQEFCQILIH